MEKVCPLCNALQAITERCQRCGAELVDGGTLNGYLGPYSPYMNENELPFQSGDYCLHLLFCPICEYDTRIPVVLVTI